MNQNIFTIKENICINPNVFRMVLEGSNAKNHKPGQFINIKMVLLKTLSQPMSGKNF